MGDREGRSIISSQKPLVYNPMENSPIILIVNINLLSRKYEYMNYTCCRENTKIPIRPYIFDIDLWSTKIWYNTLFHFICISIFVPHFYIKKWYYMV